MTKTYDNHYNWLDDNLEKFTEKCQIRYSWSILGLISAHGDKCYGYKSQWADAGIPFPHGVAIYLLSYVNPYEAESRETDNGWVDVAQWVIDNYEGGHNFKEKLPECKYIGYQPR